MLSWTDPELQHLFFNKIPLIDVRSPGEHLDGIIPNSINMPIMNDEERALVGTCYKNNGQEEAIKLGHTLVSGSIKANRITAWQQYIDKNPNSEVFCFRGGLRSQISCQWINRDKKPIPGGYKRLRRFFLSWLDDAPLSPLLRISGATGSRKTNFIKEFVHIDLEGLANHRGSAFGFQGPQPSQTTFENNLALQLMLLQGQPIIVEDESAVIGKITIPRRFYQHLRECPRVVLQVPIEKRVQNIFEDYVQGSEATFFLDALDKIEKGLGGLLHREIKTLMEAAFNSGYHFHDHEKWITSLLRDYYDPAYKRGLTRNTSIILIEGDDETIKSFVDEYLKNNIEYHESLTN